MRTDSGITEHNPTKMLIDEKVIAQAVWECLKEGDTEALIEIIQAHLYAVNIVRNSKNVDLPRSTLYSSFKGRNPTIRTLSKMLQCLD